MFSGPITALALVVAAPDLTKAPDLTTFFPDDAWIVLGIDVKAVHQSPLGKRVFGTDGPTTAARKVLAALGNPDDADDLKALAIDSLLDRVTRLTRVSSDGRGEFYRSDDWRLFLEGDCDDASLGTAIHALCNRKEVPYTTETVRERTIHIYGEKGRTFRVFRVDKTTIAIVLTAAAVDNILDLRAGTRMSKAPKPVVEATRAIDPAKTPMWLVVGENRVDDRVEYTRMVATVTLGEDVTLRVRTESPDAAAADRWRETLVLYTNICAFARERSPLMGSLAESAKRQTTGTVVTA